MEIRLSNNVSILTNVHTRSTLSMAELECRNRINKRKRQEKLLRMQEKESKIQELLSAMNTYTYYTPVAL